MARCKRERTSGIFGSLLVSLAGSGLLIGCDGPSQPQTQAGANNGQPAANATSAATPQTENAEQAIERLEREWAAAHVRKDLGWYARHVAPGYRSVLADGRVASRADIIEHLRSAPRGQEVKLEEVDVRTYGDAAIALVTQSFNTASGRTGRSRITDMWVKSADGRWMVVHSQEGRLRANGG